jgi:hypothetical protein
MINALKRFFCWAGWHSWSYESCGSDPTGFLTYAKCRWCGYEGQVDSQGNLF